MLVKIGSKKVADVKGVKRALGVCSYSPHRVYEILLCVMSEESASVILASFESRHAAEHMLRGERLLA